VAIDVQYSRLMLLCAGGDQEVWDRHAVLPDRGELALRRASDLDRLHVDAQLVQRVELGLELLRLGRRHCGPKV
jgi:hypothetical protein